MRVVGSACQFFVFEDDEGGIGDGFVCHVGTDKGVNLRLGLDDDRKPKR